MESAQSNILFQPQPVASDQPSLDEVMGDDQSVSTLGGDAKMVTSYDRDVDPRLLKAQLMYISPITFSLVDAACVES